MSRAGDKLRRFTAFLLVAVLIVVGYPTEAEATLLPPPIRLALLFERVPWQRSDQVAIPIPPGHITERRER